MTRPATVTCVFRLYVAGEALNSSQALANLQALCREIDGERQFITLQHELLATGHAPQVEARSGRTRVGAGRMRGAHQQQCLSWCEPLGQCMARIKGGIFGDIATPRG